MNIEQLRYFIQIADSGNLSKAAQKLNISQPALSKYLNNLEKTMDTEFFVSQKRTLTLTATGRLYYDMANRILRVQSQTFQTIDTLLNKNQTHIKIGVSPHRGSSMLGKVYSKFIQKHPDVVLDIIECYQKDGYALLENGEIDLLAGANKHTISNTLNKVVMCSEEVVLCVPTHHVLSKLSKYKNNTFSSINPTLFIDDPWVLLDNNTSLHELSEEIFKYYKITPSIVFTNKSINIINSILNQGNGIGFTFRGYCDLEQNECVYFSLEDKKFVYRTIFYNKNRKLTNAEKYLIALLIDIDKDSKNLIQTRNKEANDIYSAFINDEY